MQNSSRARLALLLGFAMLGGRARAASESVVAAVNGNNVVALEALAQSAPTAQQKALAVGAVLALRHKDAEAIAMLNQVAHSAAPRILRATAFRALSGVYLRDQRYRAAHSAIVSAEHLSGRSTQSDIRQSITQAPMGGKPMRVVREARSAVPITEEKEGFIRVPIAINDHRRGAMVDTGASFSTISASDARRVGIRMLTLAARVGSATESAVAVRVGIAKRVQIGQATLANVLFIVVPDADWGLLRRFKISAAIGFPVLMALGRLQIVNSGTPTLLFGAPSPKTASPAEIPRNLLLSALAPLVLVRVPGGRAPLVMKLDTGSNTTTFTRNAIADAPVLLVHAERYVNHYAGIGGAVTDRRALRLPEVTLSIAGRLIRLKNVTVSSRASATGDGVIGEDVFRQGKRWTMDFNTMVLTVSK